MGVKAGRPRRKKFKVHPLIEKIRQARIALDMSQDDLEDLTGHDRQNISEWERGIHVPSIATVADLCTALDLEIVIMKGDQRL